MTTFLSELEQDPFDGEEFIERLAWRATNGKFDDDSFDAELLHEAFENGIKDLKSIYDTNQKKCERLEMICREEEKKHWIKVAELQHKCKDSLASFEKLDKRLDVVADKVVYLGEQLEGVNTPRTRAVEAQKLMKQFARYLESGDDFLNPFEDEFDDDINKLYEEADIIQKLYLISQELPSGNKFDKSKNLISKRYDFIEKQLIEEFASAQKSDDKVKMKRISSILSHFKGYSQCVDVFIEQSQMGIFLGENIFNDIVSLCVKNQKTIKEVFTNPDQVMSKFVLNIFHGKIQEYISTKLNENKQEEFLMELFNMFSKTNKLIDQLSKLKFLGCDNNFLNKITRNIFSRYLDVYISIETNFLKEKCSAILQNYYESKNHQKRSAPAGTIQELIQSKIGRTNINLGNLATINLNLTNQEHSSETFLSEVIAISILQETKMSLQRCALLSRSHEMAQNALTLYEIELQHLCVEHIDYAIELGLQSIPPADPRSEPRIHFFDTVRQCNELCPLIEKQFLNSVLPLISSTTKYAECIKKKREVTQQMEAKLNSGLEKSISSIIGWIKYLLQAEQKKTDFKPESDDIMPTSTTACLKVVKFINDCRSKILLSLDGKNEQSVLSDLGVKIHRTIYEHFQQFQFNLVGAMVVICDVKEYRNCIDQFKLPLLNNLFNILHALCNLLIVAPENLRQVSSGDQLAGLDRTIVNNFIQLRADYKAAKLVNFLK